MALGILERNHHTLRRMFSMLGHETVIEIKNLEKHFYLSREKNNSLKQKIIHIFKSKDRGVDTYRALRGVTFKVNKGEFFGVVGRNGCGKSTLLKILAGIYQPTRGSVEVKGKLVPFIELGVGFNPELTGRENVYLNGALLGFSKKEIDDRYNKIVSFAELEEFMDQRLKNYSSGMKVRLAFSVAVQADADILLLDEVLAVGDADFQKKCFNYFNDLKDLNKTIVFVTHSMGLVKQYCDKAILIEDGKITHRGHPDEVSDEYTRLFIKQEDMNKNRNNINRFGEGGASIRSISTHTNKDKIKLDISIKSDKISSDSIVIGIDILDKNRKLVGGVESFNIDGGGMISLKPSETRVFSFEFDNIFGSGDYSVNISLKSENNQNIYDFWKGASKFVNLNKRDYDNYFPIVLPARITNIKKG